MVDIDKREFMTVDGIDENLQLFFAQYAQAYLKYDVNQLIPFFNLPCLIHDHSGVHSINSVKDLIKYEREFIDLLHKLKIVEIKTKLIRYVFSKSILNGLTCTVRYQLYNTEKHLVFDFDYLYWIAKLNDDWKIVFARIDMIRSPEA